MKSFLFIFFLFGQLTLPGQTSLPKFTSARTDSFTFLQFFPAKADFILAYSEESYWWSNTEDFKLLVRTGNTWAIWTYYKKSKSSSNVYSNDGKKKHKYFKKQANLDSAAVNELFDSLALANFWTLSMDSLNETRGSDISDDVNYKFQIENETGRQILESYAPEYYIGKFPDMKQRIIFLQGKDIFRRWWKRHAANSSFAKVGLTN
jgi:hypothetical protein